MNSYNDLKRWYSDQISGVEVSCYTLDFQGLVEAGTKNLLNLLRDDYEWEYGEDIPEEITGYQIFDLISECEA